MHGVVKGASWLMLLAMAGITAYGYWAPPAASFANPDLARIMFFHVPCAFIASWFVVWGAFCGGSYLKTRKLEWDVRLAAATELGALFAFLTITTGIIFSRVQWNHWWHWDPRQTSFLLVVLMFAGALALRSAFADDLKRASSSSGYALIMMVPAIFLTFVLPRIRDVAAFSAHPTTTIGQNQLDLYYRIGFYGTLLILSTVVFAVYRLRVRAGLIELEAAKQDELDDAGGRRSPTAGVVRPVALPEKR